MFYERCWHIFLLDKYFKTFLFFGKEKVNLTIPHCIFFLKFKLKYNEKNSIYITELKIKAIEDMRKIFFFFCIIVVVSGTLIMWVWWAGSPSWPPAAACSPRSSSTGRWPASAPVGRGNASGGSEYYFYIPRLNC